MKPAVSISLILAGIGMSAAGYFATNTPSQTTPETNNVAWSVRRVPFLAARAAERHQNSTDAVTAMGSTGGCLLAADGDGSALVSLRSDEANIPASTLKVLTGVAAMHILGEAGHLQTEVLAPEADSSGAVTDLWIRGNGDPSWATSDFIAWEQTRAFGKGGTRTSIQTLTDEIAAAGIASIASLHGDASRFSGPEFLTEWKASYRTDGEVGAISALTLNRGLQNYRATRTVPDDPAAVFAEVLAESLTARGITVGSHDSDTAPKNAKVIATRDSPPIRDLVASMIRTSDNLAAEMLIRAIGATNGAATTTGGITQAAAALSELKIATTGLRQVDGSGLARENHVTCQTVFDAITVLSEQFRGVDSLARAGSTGTLAGVGTPLKGHLFAKTGSLSGVSALAGVIFEMEVAPTDPPDTATADPETIRFAMLLQGDFGESEGARLRLQIAQALEGAAHEGAYTGVLSAP